MKKITLVCLILCLSVFLLTACTSMSTYLDRLDKVDPLNGSYTEEDFNKEDIMTEYALNADDYGFIEGEKVINKKMGTNAVIIACLSESGAKDFVNDVAGVVETLNVDASKPVKAINDGRFVLIGHESAINDLLGK